MTTASETRGAVIFDLDGTLVDSRPGIVWALEVATKDVLGQVPRGADWPIGPPLADIVASAVPDADPSQREAIANSFKAIYDKEGWKRTELIPGITMVLDRLSEQERPMHVVTNKRAAPTASILALPGLSGRFGDAISLDSVEPPYVNKAAALTALLSHRNINRRSAFYVGDTNHDGETAARVGVPFVHVAWGYASDAAGVFDGATVVQTAEQLLGAIGLD